MTTLLPLEPFAKLYSVILSIESRESFVLPATVSIAQSTGWVLRDSTIAHQREKNTETTRLTAPLQVFHFC